MGPSTRQEALEVLTSWAARRKILLGRIASRVARIAETPAFVASPSAFLVRDGGVVTLDRSDDPLLDDLLERAERLPLSVQEQVREILR